MMTASATATVMTLSAEIRQRATWTTQQALLLGTCGWQIVAAGKIYKRVRKKHTRNYWAAPATRAGTVQTDHYQHLWRRQWQQQIATGVPVSVVSAMAATTTVASPPPPQSSHHHRQRHRHVGVAIRPTAGCRSDAFGAQRRAPAWSGQRKWWEAAVSRSAMKICNAQIQCVATRQLQQQRSNGFVRKSSLVFASLASSKPRHIS